MPQDIFGSLFDHQDTRLNKLDDPLKALEKTINGTSIIPFPRKDE